MIQLYRYLMIISYYYCFLYYCFLLISILRRFSMNTIKKMLPYLIILVLVFYLTPLLIVDSGSGIYILLLINPLICFVVSILYGIKHSFHWLYAILVAILFVPTIFLYFNSSAWVYSIGYGIIALIANAIGMLFYKQSTQS